MARRQESQPLEEAAEQASDSGLSRTRGSDEGIVQRRLLKWEPSISSFVRNLRECNETVEGLSDTSNAYEVVHLRHHSVNLRLRQGTDRRACLHGKIAYLDGGPHRIYGKRGLPAAGRAFSGLYQVSDLAGVSKGFVALDTREVRPHCV